MVDWILACARKTVVGMDGPSGATLKLLRQPQLTRNVFPMTMGIQFTSMRERHWGGAPPFSNENSSFEFYTFATVLPHQNPPDHGWLTGSSPARGRRWWVWMVRLGQHWNSCSGPQPHTQRLPHEDGDPVHFNAGASLEWCPTFQQREFKL